MTPQAILVLEDGRTFRGEAYGAVGETFGEAVFTTGMTGYQETLTDPSYHRQVVVQTAPHDRQHRRQRRGRRVRPDLGRRLRRARPGPARLQLARHRRPGATRLAAEGVVGISGVDTRALTRHLRERGAMRVGVSSVDLDPASLLSAGAAAAADARRRPVRRGDHAGAVHRRRRGRAPLHGRRARPGHQAQRARAGSPRAASPRTSSRPPSTLDDLLAAGAGRGVLLARPGRPGHRRRRRSRWPARCCAGRSRCSASASAARSSAGRSASARTSWATATAASTSRCSTGPPARSR